MMVESSVDESPEKEGRGLKGQSEEGDRKKGHWDPPYPGRAQNFAAGSSGDLTLSVSLPPSPSKAQGCRRVLGGFTTSVTSQNSSMPNRP